ncbi:MAG: TetR/AcrR family transcriptional regulator [Candidatus Binatia bacterium]
MLTLKVARLPKRQGRRAESLKTAVLDAARKICFAEGVDGVSARKIAREVGCSATAIYLYYRNIEDVLHHLRMEGHSLLAEYFRGVDQRLGPLERLLEIGRAYYRFGVEHPKYYELMFLSRFKDVPRREFIQREIFTLLLVRDVVKEGIERGVVRSDVDPMVLANGSWSNMHGLTSLAISGLLFETAPGHAEELLGAVLDGIARWVRPEP